MLDLDIFQTWFLIYTLVGLIITELSWRWSWRGNPGLMSSFSIPVKIMTYITYIYLWPFYFVWSIMKK